MLNHHLLEFIHLIASQASEISDREQRKTILPEHIIEALTVCKFCSSYSSEYLSKLWMD